MRREFRLPSFFVFDVLDGLWREFLTVQRVDPKAYGLVLYPIAQKALLPLTRKERRD